MMTTDYLFPVGVFPDSFFPAGVTVSESTGDTPSYDPIPYTWENFMYSQIIGDTKSWPFQVKDDSDSIVTTLSNPTIYAKVNGGLRSEESFTISEFDSFMGTFLIDVPDTIDSVDMVSGDIVEIAIVDANGRGHLTVQFISSEVTATGGGSEIIITGYDHNATLQTLTITDSAYTTIGVERIKEIWNLSKHCLLYDYKNPSANASAGHEISIQIADGVIHYDYETSNKSNDDKIMIVVFAASA